jgi:hypothetical protein
VVQFDLRKIISDPNAPYAARVSEKTLLPGNRARLGGIRFETWLTQSAGSARAASKKMDKKYRGDQGVMMKVADIVIANVTGEGTMGKYTGSRLYPTHDEIAQLAFSLYESRGRQDGHHVEDWLRAEQELMRHYA